MHCHRQWLSRLLTLKELTLGQSPPSTCLYSASKKNTDLLLIQMTLPFLFKNLIQQLTYVPLGCSKVLHTKKIEIKGGPTKLKLLG